MSVRNARAAEAIGRFVGAFNAEDLDAFSETLADDIEIQGQRGLVRGRDEAREWATRMPSGDLRQRLLLDGVRVDGHPPVALVRRQWAWRHSGEVADEREFAVLVTVDDDGLICRWQPFDDRSQALAAAGLQA